MNRIIPCALAILAIVAACNSNNPNAPQIGTVKGTVSDKAGDPVVGVRVVVYLAVSDSIILHTANNGAWAVDTAPLGGGIVQIESLPPDCDTVAPLQYVLASPGRPRRST